MEMKQPYRKYQIAEESLDKRSERKNMIITNVKIYTEEKVFIPGSIRIEEDKIQEILLQKEQRSEKKEETEFVLDGGGNYAIPGLIDLHFHGCKGYDFCDGTIEAIENIAKYEALMGITAICPATMTLPAEELKKILSVAAEFKRRQEKTHSGSDFLGINMEGPFISRKKKGAQDERNIIPCSTRIYRQFQTAAKGLVKLIGVAPEESNAIPFIEEVKKEVKVSLAHTNASYEKAKEAFDHGACHAVHLYNAMSPFSHREPGVVGAVADSPHVMAEIICDGIHVHPAAVRATFQMLGADRIILISDSMRATGMPDGNYTLGGLEVTVSGKHAALTSDGALAGSVTNLFDCMKTAVKEMGIPLETCIACATINPAKSLGVEKTYGVIAPGRKANLILMDDQLEIQSVIKDGKIIRR